MLRFQWLLLKGSPQQEQRVYYLSLVRWHNLRCCVLNNKIVFCSSFRQPTPIRFTVTFDFQMTPSKITRFCGFTLPICPHGTPRRVRLDHAYTQSNLTTVGTQTMLQPVAALAPSAASPEPARLATPSPEDMVPSSEVRR